MGNGREVVIDGATSDSVSKDITDTVVNTVGCSAADVDTDTGVTSLATGNELTDLSLADQRDLILINIAVPFFAMSYTRLHAGI